MSNNISNYISFPTYGIEQSNQVDSSENSAKSTFNGLPTCFAKKILNFGQAVVNFTTSPFRSIWNAVVSTFAHQYQFLVVNRVADKLSPQVLFQPTIKVVVPENYDDSKEDFVYLDGPKNASDNELSAAVTPQKRQLPKDLIENGLALEKVNPKHVPSHDYNSFVQIAVKQNGLALQHVQPDALSPGVYQSTVKMAMEQDWSAIQFVKPENLSSDVYNSLVVKTVKEHGEAFLLLPETQRNDFTLATFAVRQNPDLLEQILAKGGRNVKLLEAALRQEATFRKALPTDAQQIEATKMARQAATDARYRL